MLSQSVAYVLLCVECLMKHTFLLILSVMYKSPQNSTASNRNHLFAKILWIGDLSWAHLYSLWFWPVSLMCSWPFGRSAGEQLIPDGLTHMSSWDFWMGPLGSPPLVSPNG